MKYFHRTQLSPDAVVAQAARYFGSRLSPTDEGERRRSFAGPLGQLSVTVRAEGGHYTLVTIETDQPGESEILTLLHASAHQSHEPIGAY
jgi:hypothetical protein